MKEFRVEAIAQTEFEEAALWYETQRSGLGLEFIAEVDRLLIRIAHTDTFPSRGWDRGFRPEGHVSGSKAAGTSLTTKAEHELRRRTVIGKTVGGVGLVALSFGAAEYLRHAYDFKEPPNGEDDGRATYVGAMLGGSLLLGGGMYLWLRDSQSTTHLGAGLVGLANWVWTTRGPTSHQEGRICASLRQTTHLKMLSALLTSIVDKLSKMRE